MQATAVARDRIDVSRQYVAESARNAALLTALREIVPPRMMEEAERRIGLGSPVESAVVGAIAPENPNLSQQVAAKHAGMELCTWCRGVITPSNRAVHEKCGPAKPGALCSRCRREPAMPGDHLCVRCDHVMGDVIYDENREIGSEEDE